MPRPKVRLGDRQRSTRACQTFKVLKIRCDSQHPCASCIRRGQAHACGYSGTDRCRRNSCVIDRIPRSQATARGVSFARTQDATAKLYYQPCQSDGHISELVTPESRSDDPPILGRTSRHLAGLIRQPKVQHYPLARPISFEILMWDWNSGGGRDVSIFVSTIRSEDSQAYVGSVPFTDSERHHLVFDIDHCSTVDLENDVVELKRHHTCMEFYNDAAGASDVSGL